eukprot:m51a1_g2222 hypothetical protein (1794) ;mRNA; r:222124-228161
MGDQLFELDEELSEQAAAAEAEAAADATSSAPTTRRASMIFSERPVTATLSPVSSPLRRNISRLHDRHDSFGRIAALLSPDVSPKAPVAARSAETPGHMKLSMSAGAVEVGAALSASSSTGELQASAPAQAQPQAPADVLSLANRNITALSQDFTVPEGITTVNLSGNALRALPAGLWASGASLTSLDLSDNALDSLPEALASLRCLEELRAARCRLRSLPRRALAQLEALRVLDVSHNRLDSVPPEIASLPRLGTARFDGNPFRAMPQRSALQGPWPTHELLDYARSLQAESVEWTACMVVLLGNRGVGKTGLFNALGGHDGGDDAESVTPPPGPGEPAEVISEGSFKARRVQCGQFQLQLFDFAPEVISSPVPALFFRREAVYVVAFRMDKRLDVMTEQVAPWIELINTHPLNRPSAPHIVLVGTHAEQAYPSLSDARDALLRVVDALRIAAFRSVCVDLRTGAGTSELTSTGFWRELMPAQRAYGHTQALSRLLRRRALERRYLLWPELSGLAEDCGAPLDDDKALLSSVQLLADSGEVFLMRTVADPRRRVVVVNPRLTAESARCIAESLTESGGGLMLSERRLRATWARYGFPHDLPLAEHYLRLGLAVRVSPSSSLLYLPWAAPPDAPDHAAELWGGPPADMSAGAPEGVAEHRRMWSMSLTARSGTHLVSQRLFERISISCLSLPASAGAVSAHWRRGIIVTLAMPLAAAQDASAKALVMCEQTRQGVSVALRVRAPSAAKPSELAPVLRSVCALVESAAVHLMQEIGAEPGHLAVVRSVPCPHCLELRAQGQPLRGGIHEFSYGEVAAAVLAPASPAHLVCPNSARGAPALQPEAIAPDVALCDIERIETLPPAARAMTSRPAATAVGGNRTADAELRSADLQCRIHAIAYERHRNLTRLLGVVVAPEAAQLVVEGGACGTLESLLAAAQKPSETLRLLIAHDVASALCSMHSRNPPAVHAMLRPALIDVHGSSLDPMKPRAKIAAAGPSLCDCLDDPPCRRSPDEQRARMWLAPELLAGSASTVSPTPAADVYSLGLVLWQLVTGADIAQVLTAHDRTASLTRNQSTSRPHPLELSKSAASVREVLASHEAALSSALAPLMEVALSCLAPVPSARPLVSVVVKAIAAALSALDVSVMSAEQQTRQAAESAAAASFAEGVGIGLYRVLYTRPAQQVSLKKRSSAQLDPIMRVSALCECGGNVFAGCEDGSVFVLDAVSMVETVHATPPLKKGITTIAAVPASHGVVSVWAATSANLVHVLLLCNGVLVQVHSKSLHSANVDRLAGAVFTEPRALLYAQDRVWCATSFTGATVGGALVAWHTHSFARLLRATVPEACGGLTSICASRSAESVIFCGTTHGRVLAYSSSATGKTVQPLVMFTAYADELPVRSVCYASAAREVWCCTAQDEGPSTLSVISTETGDSRVPAEAERAKARGATCLAPLCRGRAVAVGLPGSKVAVWDSEQLRCTQELHVITTRAVDNSPEEKASPAGTDDAKAISSMVVSDSGALWAAAPGNIALGVAVARKSLADSLVIDTPMSPSKAAIVHWSHVVVQCESKEIQSMMESLALFRMEFEDANISKLLEEDGEKLSTKAFRCFCISRLGDLFGGMFMVDQATKAGYTNTECRPSVVLLQNQILPLPKHELTSVGTPDDVYVAAETTAWSLASMYSEQIAVLTPNGCRTMAECAVRAIARAFAAMPADVFRRSSLKEQTIDALAMAQIDDAVDLETVDNRGWTDKKVFQMSGITTLTNESFAPDNYDPSCLWRIGTTQQALKYGMHQIEK